ncbi:MAG: hybrid sensor histidine kinase/response regulator [Candidatus Aminicenantes bacterium]|nr:hybrid sensor histidine kinase/response regulator [Candidatus Aminicenantes bacterium]
MHPSRGNDKSRIVPPPDWTPFLLNASARPEQERREWVRDLLTRESEFFALAVSALHSGWHGHDPGGDPDAESLLRKLGPDRLLLMAARLSMVRWFRRELPKKVAVRKRDRVLDVVLLTSVLAVGVAEAISGCARVEAELCGLLTGVDAWLQLSGTSPGSRSPQSGQPPFSDLISAWNLELEALPEWQRANELHGVARKMISKKVASPDAAASAVCRSLAKMGMDAADCREVMASLPWRLLADWKEIAPHKGWPCGIPGAVRRLGRHLRKYGRDGLSIPVFRRLKRQMDVPGAAADCADRILRFVSTYMPGLVCAVGWHGQNSDPGSSWWCLEPGRSLPFPPCIPRLAPDDVFNDIVGMNLSQEVFPAKGKAWLFPVQGPGKSGGWIVVSRRDGAGFSLSLVAQLESLAVRMSCAVNVHGWKEKLRAESSKNHLLKREMRLADERLTRMGDAGRVLEKAVVFQEVLPGVFHKLKNKLTPLMGYAQMLKTRIRDDYARERLEKIEQSADSLAHLLNRLRKHYDSPPSFLQAGNLNRVIRRIRPRLEEVARQHKITIAWELDGALEDFAMAEGQLEILVRELVENALRAVEGGQTACPQVTVRTCRLDSGATELRVRDNGVGIAAEDIERIWSPFFGCFSDGDGLGLAVCDHVLQRHGASRRVESRRKEFTEICIVFPGSDSQQKPLQPPTRPSPLQGRVLILDDEAYMLELMRDILQELGNLDVHATTSGTRALRWLREQEYELVIADLYVADVNGLDIFRTLNDRGMADRLILISADPGSADIRNFLESQRIVFLQKPLELMLFKQKVMEKLSQKEA